MTRKQRWSRECVADGISIPMRIRRPQEGGIVGNKLIAPFKANDGVKINSENYTT